MTWVAALGGGEVLPPGQRRAAGHLVIAELALVERPSLLAAGLVTGTLVQAEREQRVGPDCGACVVPLPSLANAVWGSRVLGP